MNTWIKVARFHLVDRLSYTALPWAILAFDFAVTMVINAMLGPANRAQFGGVAFIYVFFAAVGGLSISRSLPFALAIGVSRRSYYAGTALLAVAIGAVYGLALTVLQVIEQASGGWGVGLHFFRVAYILPGPWYLTWLTSFVLLSLMFVYGMWFGLVYRRWNLMGVYGFGAAQVAIGVAGTLAATQTHAWPAVGSFFVTLSAAGLTGLLAALAVALLAGGYATMRRVTV
jgi:hypothetical protein